MSLSEQHKGRLRKQLMGAAEKMTFETRVQISEIFTQYLKTADWNRPLGDIAREIALFYRVTFSELHIDNLDAEALMMLLLLVGIECDTLPIAASYFLFCKLPEGLTPTQ